MRPTGSARVFCLSATQAGGVIWHHQPTEAPPPMRSLLACQCEEIGLKACGHCGRLPAQRDVFTARPANSRNWLETKPLSISVDV